MLHCVVFVVCCNVLVDLIIAICEKSWSEKVCGKTYFDLKSDWLEIRHLSSNSLKYFTQVS